MQLDAAKFRFCIFLFTNALGATIIDLLQAGVSELADETDSKSVVREGVWVRVPPPALIMGILCLKGFSFFALNKGF